MSYINDSTYYENDGNAPTEINLGSYQYISLKDIVKDFQLFNVGENSWLDNVPRHKIIYFAKLAIRELHYEALKEVKALELNVSDELRYILPPDYVGLTRISLYKNGMLYPLLESSVSMTSKAYLQDNEANVLFDSDGNALSPEYSDLDRERISGLNKQLYTNPGHQYDNTYGYCYEDNWYFGGVFNLETKDANVSPRFKIDKRGGVINFNSEMSGELVVLEYVSDGMEKGDDERVFVNKIFEEYTKEAMFYLIAKGQRSVPGYVVERAKKSRRALLANAKIKISGLGADRVIQSLKGRNKQIKM
tara:strand:+ start:4082 stop:4996 length:915 start_codon:yes stop_codon:yes gene_type:complete